MKAYTLLCLALLVGSLNAADIPLFLDPSRPDRPFTHAKGSEPEFALAEPTYNETLSAAGWHWIEYEGMVSGYVRPSDIDSDLLVKEGTAVRLQADPNSPVFTFIDGNEGAEIVRAGKWVLIRFKKRVPAYFKLEDAGQLEALKAKARQAPEPAPVIAQTEAEPTVEPEAKPEPKVQAKPEPKVQSKPEVEPTVTVSKQAKPANEALTVEVKSPVQTQSQKKARNFVNISPTLDTNALPGLQSKSSKPSTEPKVEAKPKEEPKVEIAAKPAEPKVEPKPKAEPEPVAKAEPEPAPEPEPKVEPAPAEASDLAAVTLPGLSIDEIAEMSRLAEEEQRLATATASTAPAPATATPKVTSQPEPVAEVPVTPANEEPIPLPVIEAVTKAEPEPEPEPEPTVAFKPVLPEPNPEPKVQPKPKPEPKVEPQPKTEPVVRRAPVVREEVRKPVEISPTSLLPQYLEGVFKQASSGLFQGDPPYDFVLTNYAGDDIAYIDTHELMVNQPLQTYLGELVVIEGLPESRAGSPPLVIRARSMRFR